MIQMSFRPLSALKDRFSHLCPSLLVAHSSARENFIEVRFLLLTSFTYLSKRDIGRVVVVLVVSLSSATLYKRAAALSTAATKYDEVTSVKVYVLTVEGEEQSSLHIRLSFLL